MNTIIEMNQKEINSISGGTCCGEALGSATKWVGENLQGAAIAFGSGVVSTLIFIGIFSIARHCHGHTAAIAVDPNAKKTQ